MNGYPEVAVLRLGHRPGRDDRITTHVGLTARALGADRVIFPEIAGSSAETVSEVTKEFGGPFRVELSSEPLTVMKSWEGTIVHLTMYGEPVQDVEAAVRATHNEPLLIVVGAGKIPFSVFEKADWNIAVTNQPHSEIAALSVFLDRLFEGDELGRAWEDAEKKVVPEPAGKTVETLNDK